MADSLRGASASASAATARIKELQNKKDAPTIYFTPTDQKSLEDQQEKLKKAQRRLADLVEIEDRCKALEQVHRAHVDGLDA